MVREGRRREDDTLAEKCFTIPQGKGNPRTPGKVPGPDGHWIEVNRAIDKVKWEKLKDAYYRVCGWDISIGMPTKKLEALDLKDIADGLLDLGFHVSAPRTRQLR